MKRILCALLSLTVLLLAAGVSSAEAAYTPGTYTASAAGFGGEVTVTVTVDESAITDVTVEGADETPTIGGVAVANMPAAILSAGGSDVDTTTGATVTSTAILTALDEALAQASGADLTVKMAPGTYTAQAYGFQQIDPITVEVTVDETSIQDISFDGNLDSVAMIRSVNRILLPRILENQSVGVDAITGATSTSNAVLTAARDCLEQALVAGGSDAAAISAFLTPETKIEAQETLDADVLVVGMGAAGISAATAAAEAQQAAGEPVSVLAIDKDGRYGGTGRLPASRCPSTRRATRRSTTTERITWIATRCLLPGRSTLRATRRWRSSRNSWTIPVRRRTGCTTITVSSSTTRPAASARMGLSS